MEPVSTALAAAKAIPAIASMFGKKSKVPSYRQQMKTTVGANREIWRDDLLPFYQEEAPRLEAVEAGTIGQRAGRLPAWAAQMQEAAMRGGLGIGREMAPEYQQFQRDFGTLGERESVIGGLMSQAEGLTEKSPLLERLESMGLERLSRTRGEERDLAQRAYSSGGRIDPSIFGAMGRLSSADTAQRMGQAQQIAQLGENIGGMREQRLGRIGGLVSAMGDDPMRYTSLQQGYGMLPSALQSGQQTLAGLSGVGQTGAGMGYGLIRAQDQAAQPSFIDRFSSGISAGQNISKGLGGIWDSFKGIGGGGTSDWLSQGSGYDASAIDALGSTPDWMR